MAIYDYDQNRSQVFNSIEQFIGNPLLAFSGSQSKLRHLIDGGEYQQALELLGDRPSDPNLLNTKAVLLMRTGKPDAALNLLRPCVWDSTVFTLKPDVPSHVRLNLATALLMTGRVAGCLDLVHSISDVENEQASGLLEAIKSWEKSLSVFGWLDWKICGIEHVKSEILTGIDPGCFGWEAHIQPVSEKSGTISNSGLGSRGLAC